MPELPEITAAALQLSSALKGKTLARAETLHKSFTRRLPKKHSASLPGRTVSTVTRRGKHQLLHFTDGAVLLAHFRLNGEWDVARDGDPIPRFARVVLTATDGTRVSLVDSRALSTLELAASAEQAAAKLPDLGPEPDQPAFTAAALGASLARRRGPIKPALLDQRIVAGLGNIYTVEALWLARISPATPAAKLGPARLTRLVKAIRDVLRRAPAGRYWMDDRVTNWRVYDREGSPCRRCGARIRRVAQGGRSTYHCPGCQTR
jgi:formamidopyrimidine-DNA glycosylase